MVSDKGYIFIKESTIDLGFWDINGDKTVDNKHNVNYTVRLVDYDREKTLKTFYELEEAKKHFEVV